MKFVYVVFTTLSLCGFAGITVPVEVPEVEHRVMVEDFPLSALVDYGSHYPINHPTSVAINGSMIEVLQRNRAFGGIDAGESHLPYVPMEANSDLLGALDFVYDAEGAYWFVDGSNNIYYSDPEKDIQRTSQLWGHFALSEVATTPDASHIWFYDACRGDLLRVPKRMPWCYTRFSFDRPMEITGLAVDENTVFVADMAQGIQVIYQFEVGNLSMDYVSSWQVLGFEGDLITDISLVPDGSLMIATTNPELSLVLIEDKDKELDSPIESIAELEVMELIDLPENIKQPSGLWRNAMGHWFFSTDQAEVIELDEGYQHVGQFDVTYESIQCNQGCTEGISGIDNQLFVLTDHGYVARYEWDNAAYQYRQEFDVAFTGDDGEALVFSGLTRRADTNTFYLLSDGDDDQEDVLLELDASFNELSRRTLSYQGQVEGDIFQYDTSGIQYYNGKIYALSELYNDLLEISLDGEILRTFGIDRELIRNPSDLFIHNDLIYMIGDHENSEPTPPLTVFALPQ